MFGLAALIFAAIFFGAAIYISVAEHPARMGLNDGLALAQWGPSYKRGFAMQASVAVVSGVLGAAAWWTTGDLLWLAGGAVILANWPFTFIAIMPTNHLLEATPAGGDNHTRGRLQKWGQLHAIRGGLSLLATAIFFVAASRGLSA